jgi:hypothetical protein
MSEPNDELEAYLHAQEELDAAARSGNLAAFTSAELRWAGAAEAYADGLERDGHFVPFGLRNQISLIRERS